MSLRVCPVNGCPTLTAGGRCPVHAKDADTRRGTATQRGYTSAAHRRFRSRVLMRDPVCMVCKQAPSTVADHYPTSRRDLLDAGMDPDDPKAGRGLCLPCHAKETARHQPGGWANRT